MYFTFPSLSFSAIEKLATVNSLPSFDVKFLMSICRRTVRINSFFKTPHGGFFVGSRSRRRGSGKLFPRFFDFLCFSCQAQLYYENYFASRRLQELFFACKLFCVWGSADKAKIFFGLDKKSRQKRPHRSIFMLWGDTFIIYIISSLCVAILRFCVVREFWRKHARLSADFYCLSLTFCCLKYLLPAQPSAAMRGRILFWGCRIFCSDLFLCMLGSFFCLPWFLCLRQRICISLIFPACCVACSITPVL